MPIKPENRALYPGGSPASRVVLTVAHLDHDLGRNGPDDLRHMCQRCHNTHDAAHRAATRKASA